MSGVLGPPLFSAEQAAKLLDELIFERVLDLIDLEGVLQLEQELWSAYSEAGVDDEVSAATLAKATIDRALARLRNDLRRYDGGSWQSFGTDPFGDCELCEQELAAAKKDDVV